MTDLSDLIRRLEEADEGDRELDAEIAVAVLGGTIEWRQTRFTMEMYPARRHETSASLSGWASAHVEHYTTSIDAKLPGEEIEMVSIQRAPPGYPQKWAALDANWPRNKDGQYTCMRVAGIGHTEALARRIAALRARMKG